MREEWGDVEDGAERRSQTRPAARLLNESRPRVAASGEGLRPHRDRSIQRSFSLVGAQEGGRSQGRAVQASDREGVAREFGRRQGRGADGRRDGASAVADDRADS